MWLCDKEWWFNHVALSRLLITKHPPSVSERRRTTARQLMCWAHVKLSSAQPRVRRLFLTSMPTFLAWAYTILPGLVKNYSLPAQVSGNNYGTLVYAAGHASPSYLCMYTCTCIYISTRVNVYGSMWYYSTVGDMHGDSDCVTSVTHTSPRDPIPTTPVTGCHGNHVNEGGLDAVGVIVCIHRPDRRVLYRRHHVLHVHMFIYLLTLLRRILHSSMLEWRRTERVTWLA